MRKMIVAAVVTVLHTAAVSAAEEGSHPCASISDAVSRLACYDRAFGAPAVPAAPASLPQPPDPPVPATTANVPAPPAKEEFGLTAERVRKAKAPPEELEGPSSITAVVTELSNQPRGEFIVTLDNGQTWIQRETNTRARVKVGDSVTIRRASLGSYLLETSEGRITRVRRAK